MHTHRAHRALDIFIRVFPAQRERVFERHSVRNVSIQRVVRAGLVGENVGNNSSFYNFREDIGAIANQSYGNRFSIFARLID